MTARRIANYRELKESVEDAVRKVCERYKERLGEEAEIHALTAFLENLTSGAAKLYQLYPPGYVSEVKTYSSLGSSTPLTLPFLKVIYHRKMNVENAAKLALA